MFLLHCIAMIRPALTPLARLPVRSLRARPFSATARRTDIIKQLEESLTPREAVERKRKEMEEKYAAQLKQKIEA